jgi:hypothetical protein
LQRVVASIKKKTTLLLFLDSLSKNRDTHGRCFLWRQNNPEVNTPPFGSRGGGVFLGEVSSGRSHFYKKDYRGKKNEQHRYKIGTWNDRTLN